MSDSAIPAALTAQPALAPPGELRQIRQHNAITTARYEMSVLEMDIMFGLLAQLHKDDKPGTVYRLRVQELEKLTGRAWNYSRLGPAAEALLGRCYHIEDGTSWLKVSMLASAEYLKGHGVIELEISEKLRPYLVDLKDNFTSYRLQSVWSLTSKYAKRVYQLASRWKDLGESKIYTIDEFKYILHLKDPAGKEPEQYSQIAALKKFVLDVAVEQINIHTDLRISYELIKEGRSFQKVRFYIDQQRPQQLPIPFELSEDDAKVQVARKHLETLGITQPALMREILTTPKHQDELFKFMYQLKTDKIKADKNPGGLFLVKVGLTKKRH